MRRRRRRQLKSKILLGTLLGAIAVLAVYRFAFRKSIPDAPIREQAAAIITQNDCFVCHSQNPDLHFYAFMPVIGPKIQANADHAVRFTDLENKLATDEVDEVTLSMIDHAVAYGQMPPAGYRAVHWGTRFNSREKSILASWIQQERGSSEPVRIIPATIEADAAKAALGEKMFNDTRLSLDGSISCAECHVLGNGGADHADERVSEGIYGQKGGVNAPTVYNAVYNVRQFWNGRAADLQEQAAGPATNPVEMGDQTLKQVVARLSRDKALVQSFRKLYPSEGLTPNTLTEVIAEFEKTLITPGSRFDKYLQGDSGAISDAELAGYEAFKENACATCHTGILLGGLSFEELGIFGDYFNDRGLGINYNSDDDGLKGFTGDIADLHKFKTPGLRNVELTAPYFHDGSQETMEDAVRAMAVYELGRELRDSDVQAIVAFMRTLTGTNEHLKK